MSLRAMTDDDLAFSQIVYTSTRLEEVAQTGWPIETRLAFLRQQHAAQHAHYREHYVGAEWLIVERGGTPIGRLYLHERDDDLRIVDVALLPDARGQGIGAALIGALQQEMGPRGKTVSIHVEKNNPARSLYFRLGFVVTDEDRGPYDLMEWFPEGREPPPSDQISGDQV